MVVLVQGIRKLAEEPEGRVLKLIATALVILSIEENFLGEETVVSPRQQQPKKEMRAMAQSAASNEEERESLDLRRRM